MAWFDLKTQAEVLNFKVFSDIKNSIGVSGVTGLDRLICFMIVTKLQVMHKNYEYYYFCCRMPHYDDLFAEFTRRLAKRSN